MSNPIRNNSIENSIYLGASPKLLSLAKELRKNMTEAEAILRKKLKNKQLHGLKFRRQHPILKFIVDFYCHEKLLVIEIDGEYHNTREQKEYDLGRSYELEKCGIKVVRFKNEEVFQNIEAVLSAIRDHLFTP